MELVAPTEDTKDVGGVLLILILRLGVWFDSTDDVEDDGEGDVAFSFGGDTRSVGDVFGRVSGVALDTNEAGATGLVPVRIEPYPPLWPFKSLDIDVPDPAKDELDIGGCACKLPLAVSPLLPVLPVLPR